MSGCLLLILLLIDKNPGDETAHERFQKVSNESYVLGANLMHS